jgi:hypothetical protein
MTIHPARSYEIYTIGEEQIYALLDKAHCALLKHDDDSCRETLVLPSSARYENMSLRDDIGRFDVYCPNGYAFRLTQHGPSVEQTFMFYAPSILPFATKISFKQAMELANVTFDQLSYASPFPTQVFYDMAATLPVSRPQAAFALARLSMLGWLAFSFESVQMVLNEESEETAEHE